MSEFDVASFLILWSELCMIADVYLVCCVSGILLIFVISFIIICFLSIVQRLLYSNLLCTSVLLVLAALLTVRKRINFY
jgi:hypothetical protein